MLEFCTYFDQRYLPRGLALYRSLARHCESFRLWVLCLDDETYRFLKARNLPSLELISIGDFESADTELAAARATRSTVEYYFTCTPRLPLHLFEQAPEIELLTYLDADMYLLADPSSFVESLAGKSVALTPHRYVETPGYTGPLGKYNVGWLSLRRDAPTLALLQKWRAQCIEWCYMVEEDNRFADQKYLDSWPDEHPGVWVIDTPGVGSGPWNLHQHRIAEARGRATIDSHPLIAYHFSGIVRVNPWVYDSSLPSYRVQPSGAVRDRIYAPYIAELSAAQRDVDDAGLNTTPLRTIHDFAPNRLKPLARLPGAGAALRLLLHVWRGVVKKGYFYVFGARVS